MNVAIFSMIPPGVGSAVTGASVQHIGASLCLNSDPPPLVLATSSHSLSEMAPRYSHYFQ